MDDENIYEVNIDSYNKKITVKPVQNEFFGYIREPLRRFFDDKYAVIGGRRFKISDYEHFNGQIYYITLKEI